MVDKAEKTIRFEVYKTLIRGKQTPKRIYYADGSYRIQHHGLPVGYIMNDLEKGKLVAVAHAEASQLAGMFGIKDVRLTQTVKKDPKTGEKIASPYIRAGAGCKSLQDPSFVVSPDRFLGEHPEIEVTERLKKLLKKKPHNSAGSNKSGSKYTKEELLKAVELQLNRLDKEIGLDE